MPEGHYIENKFGIFAWIHTVISKENTNPYSISKEKKSESY